MKECYQCNAQVHELSERSRCVKCEYERAMYNEIENEVLRGQVYTLEEIVTGLTSREE